MKLARIFSSLAALALLGSSGASAIVGPARDVGSFSDRVVMVLTRGGEGSGFCTGVVLAPRIVLTAAHCLRAAANIAVLYRDGAGAPVLIPVAATAGHPRYHADAVRKRIVSIDLGLIETATPLPATFRAAELADATPGVGDTVTLVGFGIAREGEPKTGGTARTATLRVSEPLSQILLWAGDPGNNGSGACSGDSGGPLFASDGRTVLGLVAWTKGEKGRKCGITTQGPLVAPARAWIAEVVANWRP
jgi:hypothetical protein